MIKIIIRNIEIKEIKIDYKNIQIKDLHIVVCPIDLVKGGE